MDVLIKRRRSDGIIKFLRLPPTKTLRAHLFGLTLAVVGAFYTIIFDHAALFQGLPWYTAPLAIGIFIFGTYLSGPFVILTAILFFFTSKQPEVPPQFFSSVAVVAAWYFLFYAVGAILTTLYNALAFLNVMLCCKKQVQLAFAYNPKKKVNIIKSPEEIEELAMLEVLKPVMFYVRNLKRAGTPLERQQHAQDLADLIRRAKGMMPIQDQNRMHEALTHASIVGVLDDQIDGLQNLLENVNADALKLLESELEPVVEHYLKRKEQKLYQFHLKAAPVAPYTIVLVANPSIGRHSSGFDPDPIMADLDLFLRTVNNALDSLERDEVVGQHEIWSRVRVVTIFDDTATNDLSLLQDFFRDIDPQQNVAENLIYPRAEMAANVLELLRRHQGDLDEPLPENQIDVIFAATASPTQIRPTACYADFDETVDFDSVFPPQPPDQGTGYTYDPNPANTKGNPPGSEINVKRCGPAPALFRCIHDDYSAIPGRVALNALSARRHTFIHEFAHAMSSAVRGCIGDEYYDKSFLLGKGESRFIPLYVNRIERAASATPANFIPVHPVFASYNSVIYRSDLAHPSAEENWLSYFPERHSHGEICTMDRTVEPFRFDQLISRFIYDRLASKLNRPH